jgi:Helicase associated domain
VAAIATYAHRHGHTRVPDGGLDETGFPLAVWVAEQRVAQLEGRLAPRRRAALEQIGGWRWEPVSNPWNRFGKDGS